MARRSAEPSASTCCWPTNSSSVLGLSRCASGANAPTRCEAASEKRSPMRRSMLRALRDEVTDLLSRLIRVDTTNPPGNETAAAELLRDYLEPHGVVCELYARVPERANLVARIPGRGDGPTPPFLSHTDVVPTDAAEWQLDPFGREVPAAEAGG